MAILDKHMKALKSVGFKLDHADLVRADLPRLLAVQSRESDAYWRLSAVRKGLDPETVLQTLRRARVAATEPDDGTEPT